MTKRMQTVAAILGVVLVGGSLTACKHHSMGSDHTKQIKEHLDASLKKVDATAEQRAKIGSVVDEISADGKQICAANQGLKAKVVGCLLLDTPNSTWLHATVDEKAKELTGFAHRTVDRLIRMSAVLSPEQRAELKKRFEHSHGEKKAD
jgi:Spy/CpxP family protein refolding chaperone